MFWQRSNAAPPNSGTRVTYSPGEVRVTSRQTLALNNPEAWTFIARALSLAEVDSLEVDRVRGVAIARFDPQKLGLAEFLDRFAAVLAGGDAETSSGSPESRNALAADYSETTNGAAAGAHANSTNAGNTAQPQDSLAEQARMLAKRRRFRLVRRGHSLSTWEVVHTSPGRLRVRNISLEECPELTRRLTHELETHPGVLSVVARQLTNTLLVQFHPGALDQATLLQLLDRLISGVATRTPPVTMPSRTVWGLAQTSLALALGGLLFPPLVPASGLLLLIANVPNFRAAWRHIRQRQTSLPLLYTTIVVVTLITSGYVAASIMNLFLLYWQERRARLAIGGHHAIGSAWQRPARSAWLVRDGVELEVAAADLQSGEVVVLHAGEIVPADGRLVQGSVLIEDPLATGSSRLAWRVAGDEVLDGCYVVDGMAHVEVHCGGDATVSKTIGRTLSAAVHTRVVKTNERPPQVADRAVPPVLLAAGMGLLVGDANSAAAILRPDYASGPQAEEVLATICHLGACIEAGIVVRQSDALEQIAALDTMLFDFDDALVARGLVVAEITTVGQLTAGELLRYAECGVRELSDPRGAALRQACDERGIQTARFDVQHGACVSEFYDQETLDMRQVNGSRLVQVDELIARGTGTDSRSLRRTLDLDRIEREEAERLRRRKLVPLRVSCNGQVEGYVTFRESGYLQQAPLAELRTKAGLQLGVLIPEGDDRARQVAAELGFDAIFVCSSDAAKAEAILALERRGRRVGYVGHAVQNPLAARAASMVISTVETRTLARQAESDPSSVWLVGGDYRKLIFLRELAASKAARSRTRLQMTMIPNVVCVAGAFLFGLTSLAVVFISNLGTYTVFTDNAARLALTERRLTARRNRFLNYSAPDRSEREVKLTVTETN